MRDHHSCFLGFVCPKCHGTFFGTGDGESFCNGDYNREGCGFRWMRDRGPVDESMGVKTPSDLPKIPSNELTDAIMEYAEIERGDPVEDRHAAWKKLAEAIRALELKEKA